MPYNYQGFTVVIQGPVAQKIIIYEQEASIADGAKSVADRVMSATDGGRHLEYFNR
jgi:hypothetical protein